MTRGPTQPRDGSEPGDGAAGSWSLVWRLLGLGRRFPGLIVAAILVTVAVQFLVVGELFGAGLAIDVLRREVDANAPAPNWPFGLAPGPETPFLVVLAWVSAAVLTFSVLRAVGYFLSRWVNELLAQAIIVDLRDRVYEKLQVLPFRFYDTHDSGTVINRVTGDVQSVRTFVQGVLVRAMTALAAFAVYLGTMFSLHVGLTLVTLAAVAVQVVVMFRFARHVKPQFREQRKIVDDLILLLSEMVQGIRVTRAFGREKEAIDRFDRQSAAARDQRQTIWRMMGNHMPWIMGAGWMAVAVLIGYGGHLVLLGPAEGGIALGTIWIFFGLLRSLASQTERIMDVAGQVPDALTGAERVFEILDEDPAIASPEVPAAPGPEGPAEIELVGVTFGYDPGEPVLRDVSLRVEAGETVALVGPTGAGKSTLLQLIPRFYDPQEGRVLVDGVDVREWDLAALRARVGFVFQEPFLFSNTLASNVAFGRPDASMDDVRDATRVAAADEFLAELPSGYETIIGERGMTLSGGERQRVSLARAVVTRPGVLLLDDAMSAVDAATEVKIQNALAELGAKRTQIVVAHRLSTLRRADRIVVLEAGRIDAVGTHEELMASDGHYREAALLQLRREREEAARHARDERRGEDAVGREVEA